MSQTRLHSRTVLVVWRGADIATLAASFVVGRERRQRHGKISPNVFGALSNRGSVEWKVLGVRKAQKISVLYVPHTSRSYARYRSSLRQRPGQIMSCHSNRFVSFQHGTPVERHRPLAVSFCESPLVASTSPVAIIRLVSLRFSWLSGTRHWNVASSIWYFEWKVFKEGL